MVGGTFLTVGNKIRPYSILSEQANCFLNGHFRYMIQQTHELGSMNHGAIVTWI